MRSKFLIEKIHNTWKFNTWRMSFSRVTAVCARERLTASIKLQSACIWCWQSACSGNARRKNSVFVARSISLPLVLRRNWTSNLFNAVNSYMRSVLSKKADDNVSDCGWVKRLANLIVEVIAVHFDAVKKLHGR